MTEKTLSILGVIKKKLDSLDRGSKNKASNEDLSNEFDYVVPAKKSNEIKGEENNGNQQQVSKNSQETKMEFVIKPDSKQPSATLPQQSSDNPNESKFDFNLNFTSDNNSTENIPSTKKESSADNEINKLPDELNNLSLANLESSKNNHGEVANSSKSEFDFEIENIIEEYEDELSDEDLDGGVSSSSIYNLYIKNHNAEENFASDEFAINNSEISKEISSNSSQENNDLSLNFADDLSIADEKLFGNSATNSLNNLQLKQENLNIDNQSNKDNQPNNLANMKTPEVTLFSKLSSQINKEKSSNLNLENLDQKNYNEVNLNDHSELDFLDDHTDLKIEDLNNLQSKDNTGNQTKVEISNESKVQQNLIQNANKNEIDLEFEKELTHLDGDNSAVIQNNNNPIFTLDSDSKIDNLKVDNSQDDSILFEQKNQVQDKIISPSESQDHQQVNSILDNHPMQSSSKDDLDDLEIASQKIFGSTQENNLATEQSYQKPIDIINNNQKLTDSVDNSALSSSANKFTQNINNISDDISNHIHQIENIVKSNSNSPDHDGHDLKQDLHEFENDHLSTTHNDNHGYQGQITRPILHDEVIMQSSNSIQKLLDTKAMMSGISNFMQSPYPIEIAVQLMEPKLERWMNENLAQIVEKVVREEISKIIPKN